MCQRKKRPKIFPKANQTNEKKKTEAVTQKSKDDLKVFHSQWKNIKKFQPCVRGETTQNFTESQSNQRKIKYRSCDDTNNKPEREVRLYDGILIFMTVLYLTIILISRKDNFFHQKSFLDTISNIHREDTDDETRKPLIRGQGLGLGVLEFSTNRAFFY